MNVHPDTLSFVKRLEAAGLDRTKAEAIAEGSRDLMTDELVTKSDLAEIRAEMTDLKAELSTSIANVRADLSRTIYISSLGTIALLFALLRFTG